MGTFSQQAKTEPVSLSVCSRVSSCTSGSEAGLWRGATDACLRMRLGLRESSERVGRQCLGGTGHDLRS